MFLLVLPVACRGASRSFTFVIVRRWLSAFLSNFLSSCSPPQLALKQVDDFVFARGKVCLPKKLLKVGKSGTDGRPMIPKKPSVTGRHKRPVVQSPFFVVPASLFIHERI